MNLAQALKKKNSLIGEINRLKSIFIRENRRQEDSKSKVDRAQVMRDILGLTQELVNLKSSITRANVGIYPTLCELEEAKAWKAWLETVPVDPTYQRAYGIEAKVYEYNLQMDQDMKDEMLAQTQRKIESLQDDIDTFNATTKIA